MVADTVRSYSDDEINRVWEKATIVDGEDPNKRRKDIAGAWISRDKYGSPFRELDESWEIDHRKPQSKGGSDSLYNLRPLQWKNNRSKSDDYPIWTSEISSSGNQNIYKTQKWEITE